MFYLVKGRSTYIYTEWYYEAINVAWCSADSVWGLAWAAMPLTKVPFF